MPSANELHVMLFNGPFDSPEANSFPRPAVDLGELSSKLVSMIFLYLL
jgi:hypothetical protein